MKSALLAAVVALLTLPVCRAQVAIEVDPSGPTLAPGLGVRVTGNNAWTTSLPSWSGTTWDTNTLESWTATGASTATFSGGVLTATSNSGADPRYALMNISNGPDLDLGWNDFVEFRLRLPANYAGDIELFYGVAEADIANQTGFTNGRRVIVPNSSIPKDGQFHVYRLDMGLVAPWRGRLNDLRLDPATLASVTFSLDYIRVGDVPGNDYTARVSTNCPAHGQVVTLGNRTHTVRSMESKRFRIIYSDLTLTEDPGVPWSDAQSRGTLRNLEEVWQVFIKKHGYREPCFPIGTTSGTTKFKSNMTMIHGGGTWAGGDFDPANGGSYGWQNTYPAATRVHPPSWVNAHEFMHVCQMHQEGGYRENDPMGKWWEAHANYGQELYVAHYTNLFPGESGLADSFPLTNFLFHTHGRHYYDCWPIFTYLDDNPDQLPDLGGELSRRLWRESQQGEYLYTTIERLTPTTSLKDVIGNYARRNATWDYTRQSAMQARAATFDQERTRRYQFAPASRRADDPSWWQVPAHFAPQAFAYTIHLLTPSGSGDNRTVSVNFRGISDPERQSDWRASLVVVNSSGVERYSPLWSNGTQSVTLSSTENTVYLAVAATPGEVLPTLHLDQDQPYQSDPAKTRFPYEFQVTGATPANPVVTGSNLVVHANGGGRRASSATVASTVFIAPNALVLDSAVISGTARIEDAAVVRGTARVSETAVISGNALVRGNAIVRGRAKVRDHALLEGNAVVEGDARVGGHAWMLENARATETATIKGAAQVYGSGVVSGDAVLDGDSTTGSNISNGFQFGWAWGGQTPAVIASRTAPTALFSSYTFATNHPYAAKDQFGVTDARLIGSPAWSASDGTRSGFINFNGSGQYALLDRFQNDLRETTITAWVKWDGGANQQPVFHFGNGTTSSRFYLTPRNADGNCEFQVTHAGTTYSATATSAMAVGQWTRVAVTLDGTTAALYLNGTLAASTPCPVRPQQVLPANTTETPAHNYLARGTSLPDFAGSIDDFTIYSTAFPGLSSVRLSPSSGNLAELSNPLQLTISRTLADATLLNTPLVVNYTVSGTATPGVDVIGLAASGSVTIPAGQWSVTVPISAVPDTSNEGNETFVVTLAPSPNYGITNGTASITVTERVPMEADLLAWYRFNETSGTTATDSGTRANHATLLNGPSWNQGALSFDGSDDEVQTPVANGSVRTLAAWIFPRSSDPVGNFESVFDCDVPGQFGTGWGLNNGSLRVILDDQFWDPGVAIALNQWQHVALTYDATQARLYLNGELRASLNYTQGAVTAANFRIGRSNANLEFFHGDIRDAKIFQRAITQVEIAEVMNGPAPAPTSPPQQLTATSGNGRITLGWQAANSGETWYAVRRATQAGGPYQPVSGALTETSFTDTDVQPGTSYFYVVVAGNNQGISPISNEANATAASFGNGIWSGPSGGNWSNAANWQAGTIADGSGNSASFLLGSPITAVLDANRTVGALVLANANHTLSGSGVLTLAMPSGVPAVSVGANAMATITAALAGSQGFTLSGPGTLVLPGAWNVTGPIAVQSATLASGAPAGTSLALPTLQLQSATLTGLNTPSGTLGHFQLRGDVTVSGSSRSVISADVRAINNETRNFAVAATGDPSGVDLLISGKVGHHNGTAWGFFSKTGPGTLLITGVNELGSLTVHEGTAILENAAVAGLWNGGLISHARTDLRIGESLAVSFPQAITGNGSLTKSGPGTLELTAVSSHAGGTTVEAGTLVLATGNAGGTGRLRGALSIRPGAVVETTGDGTGLGWVDQISSVSITGGTLTTAGIMHVWNIPGGITFTGGRLESNRGSHDPNGPQLEWNRTSVTTLAHATPATIAGRIRMRGDGNFQAIQCNVADGDAETDLVISAAVTEASPGLGMTKSGPGKMSLAGVCQYSGPTTVQQGTLRVESATLNDAAMLDVASGARVELAFAGADQVGLLRLGGVLQSPGTYNATSHPQWFVGSGSITVPALNLTWNNSANTGVWSTEAANWSGLPWIDGAAALLQHPSAQGSISIVGQPRATSIAIGNGTNQASYTLSSAANSHLAATSLAVMGEPSNHLGTNPTATLQDLVLTLEDTLSVGRAYLAIGGGSVISARQLRASSDWGELILRDQARLTLTDGIDTAGLEAWGLRLNGGTLVTPSLQYAPHTYIGATGLHFNGTTVRASATAADFIRTSGSDDAPPIVEAGGARFDTNGYAVAIQRGFTGNGSLTKLGTGSLTLNGNHSYSGTTVVEAGSLFVGGSLASTVEVRSEATLGGSGSVQGAVTLPAGSTLAPGLAGQAIGTFRAGASLSLAGTLAIDLANGSADRLVVGGNFDLSAATLALSGTTTAESLVLAEFGSVTGSQFAAVSGLPVGYTVRVDESLKQVLLVKQPSFASWMASEWPNLADPAAGADPDGDGVSNLLEYVLGGDPSQPDQSLAKTIAIDAQEQLLLSFQRADRAETSDVAISVELSTDLRTWQASHTIQPGPPTAGVTIEERDTQPDLIRVTIPPLPSAQRFARIRVTLQP